jgi:hypothetical protein
MSDFETRLRLRLQRLDAAVPPARPPSVVGRPRGRPNRRRQLIVLFAAALVLFSATSLVAIANAPPPDPAVQARDTADEERVRDDLGRQDDSCLSASAAQALYRERLDALGLRDWTIRVDGRVREARCVGGAAIGDSHEVLLTPSMGGDVAKALDALSSDLMRRCLGRSEAIELIRSTLTGLGVSYPKVEAGGIRGVPLEYGDAYVRHVADGCYVYGGAQFDDVGRYTWFVSGN